MSSKASSVSGRVQANVLYRRRDADAQEKSVDQRVERVTGTISGVRRSAKDIESEELEAPFRVSNLFVAARRS